MPASAVVPGDCIIEEHFVLSRNTPSQGTCFRQSAYIKVLAKTIKQDIKGETPLKRGLVERTTLGSRRKLMNSSLS